MASHVAVFLPNDNDAVGPSYFFGPSGGKFKLFKVTTNAGGETAKEEVAVIKSGWQSTNTDTSSDIYTTTEVTGSASKTLTVETIENGIEKKVKVSKRYERGMGTTVEFDSGFAISTGANGVENYEELTRDGMVVAKIFDKTKAIMEGEQFSENPQQSAFRSAMEMFQSPTALLLSNRLSENEKIQIITIAATANHRLIRTAMLDVSSSTYNNNDDYYHNNGGYYDNGGGYDGGGGGDDYGGGGGDWGGGDDGGGDGGGD